MILVEGSGTSLQKITLTKNGQKVILTDKSDPKELFSALSELARYVVSHRKDQNERSIRI